VSTTGSRQTRKRLATRQAISDAATRLFFDRGFDRVTIEESAEAADVGRMTVFNHFRRKEDMFFDLDDELRDDMVHSLQEREPEVTPVEAFRRLAHRAVADGRDYVCFSPESQRFVETMEASVALMARWRALRDETAAALADTLATVVGRHQSDPEVQLAAHLLVAAWSTATTQGQAAFRASRDRSTAEATFLSLIDRGCTGVTSAMAGTPYA
jgi:AcrR family transcriptional regulator